MPPVKRGGRRIVVAIFGIMVARCIQCKLTDEKFNPVYGARAQQTTDGIGMFLHASTIDPVFVGL